MRKFTTPENEWIQRFVETKEEGIEAIQELQVAKLLKNHFSFFALKWTFGDKPQISFYNKKDDSDEGKALLQKQYYEICDFIYFIKELESLGFIAVQKLSTDEKDTTYNILLDREKYSYNEKRDRIELIKKPPIEILKMFSDGNPLLEEFDSGVYGLLRLDTQNINLDFAYDLQKYGKGIIYPLPLAKDYVDNKFKTLEDRHHDEEMDVALKSARSSATAAIIAGLTLLVSVLTTFITCHSTN